MFIPRALPDAFESTAVCTEDPPISVDAFDALALAQAPVNSVVGTSSHVANDAWPRHHRRERVWRNVLGIELALKGSDQRGGGHRDRTVTICTLRTYD
jgi:hypothetical protein